MAGQAARAGRRRTRGSRPRRSALPAPATLVAGDHEASLCCELFRRAHPRASVRALREALAGADRARRARLERLRKAVREGSYAIPVAALAAAMQREGRLFNATVPL